MITLGIDPRKDPMYDYGEWLPVRKNIASGEREMAMPTILRDMVRGLLDVAESRESGVFRPTAFSKRSSPRFLVGEATRNMAPSLACGVSTD